MEHDHMNAALTAPDAFRPILAAVACNVAAAHREGDQSNVLEIEV
jgi:hypothetical protein